MPKSERESFEQDYRDWIRLMSRDAAYRLAALPSQRQKDVLKAYEEFKNPLSVFRAPSDPERLRALAPDAGSKSILLEMDCITFFPSFDSFVPGIQDYAVVTNRRIFSRKLWFPIISLNSQYIQKSSDRVLAYALEHEYELARIYQELCCHIDAEILGDKRPSAKKPTITAEELADDELLMTRLSRNQPLLPQPYVERAMHLYLDANFTGLQHYGQQSVSPEEEAQGEEQNSEFRSWEVFSQKTYEIFVREIRSNLLEANRGYG
ncbi:Uncharacterised protein [uncultured archaeon]|nr:Uncharacterised protein [uncultured archaeon]